MSLDQFRRSTTDDSFADQVLEHFAGCTEHTAPGTEAKFEVLIECLVAREGIGFATGAEWMRDIMIAEKLNELRERQSAKK